MAWRDWISGRQPAALPAPVADPVAHVDAAQMIVEFGKLVASGEITRMDSASIMNALTGLGGIDDKGAFARPNLLRQRLTDVELLTLYINNGLMQRVANIVPKEMTRKGWVVTDSTDDPDLLAKEDRRLKVNQRIREATTWARVLGGAVILMVTDETVAPGVTPEQHLLTPLDLTRVRALKAIQVFDAWEATPWLFDADIESPNYREPASWSLQPSVVGPGSKRISGLVHASRVLYFPGVRRPPSIRFGGFSHSTAINANRGLDDSVYQAIWDQARNLDQTMAGGAVLAQEIRENVLKIGGLAALVTADQKEAVEMRIRLLGKMKSLLGTVIVSENDEYTSKVNAPSGFRDLSAPAMAMVSAVTGIALTILFGFAPSGLSTDDKMGRQSFDRLISGEQEGIRPQLERYYEVVFSAKEGPTDGKIPDEWALAFLPLDEETEKEVAEKRKTVAETDAIYIDSGVLSPGRVREARFGPAGYQFELLPEEVDGDDVEDVDDPAEAAAILGDLGAGAGAPLDGAQLARVVEMVVAELAKAEVPRADQDPRQTRAALNTDEAVWLAVFPSTDEAIMRVAEFRRAAETALGVELLDPPVPHATLLFVGPVGDADMPALLDEVRVAVADVQGPIALHPQEVQAFDVGGNGRSAVVLRLGDFDLEALHSRLLRALAPRVTAEQFPDFKAHLTLGSVEGEADRVALAEMEAASGAQRFEPIAMVGQVVVLRGGERVAEVPLAARVDGGGERVAK
jgi:phage-related protein (TIGR01555 family)